MSQLHYAIGVDLGGTTIKTGIVNSGGKIIAQSKFPSLGDQGPKAVIAQIRQSIEEVLPSAREKLFEGSASALRGL